MIFHTFGCPSNKAVVLIHGVLTPWQMWEYQIDKLIDDYYVIVPALDGHTEEEASKFESVKQEAALIEYYIIDNLNGKVYAVCGISMGGAVSAVMWKNGRIKMEKLIMDGSPFGKLPKFMIDIMVLNYLKIVHSSQKRDPKTLEGFKKNLLPEKYLPNYLAFIDKMSDETVTNIVYSVFDDNYPDNVVSDADVLFMHGTKANEVVAVKAAKRLKKEYPNIRIICRKGHIHCENALFHPDKWYSEIVGFLNNEM